MRLIGMLDSPFVRRVAITLHQLGVEFTHEPVSVFSTFAQFQAINPVVKAPSAVLDDGTVARVRIAPEGTPAANPAFDVTPARLITAIVTEAGVAPASVQGLAQLKPDP